MKRGARIACAPMISLQTVYSIMRNKYVLSAFVLAVAAIFAVSMLFNHPQASGEEAASKFWAKRCEKDSSYCEIYQTLTVKKTGQRLLEFALGYPKDQKGKAQAVVILPLGVIMTDGIGIQVDEGEMNKAMVRFCNTSGCYVYMTLPDKVVESMDKGKAMSVLFLDGAGKKVRIQMPLEGFGAARKQID